MQNRLFATLTALTLATLLQSACATVDTSQADSQSLSDHPPPAPSSFLASYPRGSQTRRSQDVDTMLNSSNRLIFPLLKDAAARNHALSGKMTYALALGSDGHVEGLSLLDDTIGDRDLTKKVTSIMFGLNFGPAIGNGYYVVYYQYRLNRKT